MSRVGGIHKVYTIADLPPDEISTHEAFRVLERDECRDLNLTKLQEKFSLLRLLRSGVVRFFRTSFSKTRGETKGGFT